MREESMHIAILSPPRSPDIVRIDRLKIFLDSMGGGAWPFLVGGVICNMKPDKSTDGSQ
jgi:hypothetical protein